MFFRASVRFRDVEGIRCEHGRREISSWPKHVQVRVLVMLGAARLPAIAVVMHNHSAPISEAGVLQIRVIASVSRI